MSEDVDCNCVDSTVAVFGWRWRCGTISVTGSVQHSTVAALENNRKSKSYKRMI